MKKGISILAVVVFVLVAVSIAWADDWGVIANLGQWGDPEDPDNLPVPASISTVNLSTSPPQVYGPFLEGQLDPIDPDTLETEYGDGLLDVCIVPGTTYALVSLFGINIGSLTFIPTIYRVNLSNPKNPVLAGSVELIVTEGEDTTILFAEDIAVSPDGRLAIVSDGGLSSLIAFIDLSSFTLNSLFELPEVLPTTIDPETPIDDQMMQAYAQAVAIAPDGQTVLMADYLNGCVIYGTINATRDGLDSVQRLPLCPTYDPVTGCSVDEPLEYLGWPLNISISPDGQTAIVADAFRGFVFLLRITGPGQVERGNPFFLTGLPGTQSIYDTVVDECEYGGSQSIAFSPDGHRAYVLSNNIINYIDAECNVDPDIPYLPDTLSWLNITGPGSAAVGGSGVTDLISCSSSKLFGVDVLDITPDGLFALASNPNTFDASNNISLISLDTFGVQAININSEWPVGLDIFSIYETPFFTPLGMSAMLVLFGSLGFIRLRKRR